MIASGLTEVGSVSYDVMSPRDPRCDSTRRCWLDSIGRYDPGLYDPSNGRHTGEIGSKKDTRQGYGSGYDRQAISQTAFPQHFASQEQAAFTRCDVLYKVVILLNAFKDSISSCKNLNELVRSCNN